MNLPSAIGGGYFLEELYSTPELNFLYLMDNLLFSYHAFHFVIFTFANKRLFSHVKRLFKIQDIKVARHSNTHYFVTFEIARKEATKKNDGILKDKNYMLHEL